MSAGWRGESASAGAGAGAGWTYLGEDGGGEAGDDAAAERNRELACAGEVLARLLGEASEDELVAELVHGELPDGVRDLPVCAR